MILFIKHISIEGPGTLGSFLKSEGFEINTTDLSQGERLPDSLDSLDAVISLGGPMNVYEEDKYLFLKQEDGFLKSVLDKEIPFLGICLGAQLLAKACSAKVIKSPGKEVGFFKVSLNASGAKDEFFQGIKNNFRVFQWHEDMFEVPKKGQLLASSLDCPNQAFKVGKNAYGIQFHVEIDDIDIYEWGRNYFSKEEFDIKSKEMAKIYKANK
ncbi:MAG: type 1 glutamine amidotransferase, partial [Candidatus Omnitrophica bacterium]|nr:type 1 glutamine amidotransferase [Candidatus Omnitrophota bacterium]